MESRSKQVTRAGIEKVFNKVDRALERRNASLHTRLRVSSLLSPAPVQGVEREQLERQSHQEKLNKEAELRRSQWKQHLDTKKEENDAKEKAVRDAKEKEAKFGALKEELNRKIGAVSKDLRGVAHSVGRNDGDHAFISYLVGEGSSKFPNQHLLVRVKPQYIQCKKDIEKLVSEFQPMFDRVSDLVNQIRLETQEQVKEEVEAFCIVTEKQQKEFQVARDLIVQDIQLSIQKSKLLSKIYHPKYRISDEQRDSLCRRIDIMQSLADVQGIAEEIRKSRIVKPAPDNTPVLNVPSPPNSDVRDGKHSTESPQPQPDKNRNYTRIKEVLYKLTVDSKSLESWNKYLHGGCLAGSRVNLSSTTFTRVPDHIKKTHDIFSERANKDSCLYPDSRIVERIFEEVFKNIMAPPSRFGRLFSKPSNRDAFTHDTYQDLYSAILAIKEDRGTVEEIINRLESKVAQLQSSSLSCTPR